MVRAGLGLVCVEDVWMKGNCRRGDQVDSPTVHGKAPAPGPWSRNGKERTNPGEIPEGNLSESRAAEPYVQAGEEGWRQHHWDKDTGVDKQVGGQGPFLTWLMS